MGHAGKSRAWDASPAPAGPPERGSNHPYPAAHKSLYRHHLSIINHQSPFLNRKAFTLIELLVVISIIALLLAILFPALQAGRSHARTAACQGTLHQWGVFYATYTAENDYKMPANTGMTLGVPDVLPRSSYKHRPDSTGDPDTDYWDLHVYKRLLLCPEASALPANPEFWDVHLFGRTHSPWVHWFGLPRALGLEVSDYGMSSYGFDGWTISGNPKSIPPGKLIWVSCLVKGAAGVPVYFDCMYRHTYPQDTDIPAPIEDAPPQFFSTFQVPLCAMDRHRGGINSLFMDWSVRKVGIKENWILKWSPDYNTAGRWTKQAGVQPEDWPQWMRRFKDY